MNPRSWLLEHGELFALLVLPLLVLLLDDDLFFSGPHRDAWIYFGYFQDGIDYLRRFPDLYYGSRLSVIVPGYLAVHLLPPVAANVALRLAVSWTTLTCFWYVGRERCGRRATLLAGLALVGYPFFVRMEGWNYVDGFGVAYFAVAMAFAAGYRRAGGTARLFAAGVALTSMVTANLVYFILVPLCLMELAIVSPGSVRWRRLAGLALGAAGGVAGFAAIAWLGGGSPNYLRPALAFGANVLSGAQPDVWRRPLAVWLPRAYHLLVPSAVLLATVVGLARRPKPSERYFRLVYVVFAVLVVLAQWSGRNLAQMAHGASVLILPAFWALAAHFASAVAPLPPRRFVWVACLAGVGALIPYVRFNGGAPILAELTLPILLAVGCGMVVAALLQPGLGAVLMTVGSLAFVSLALREGLQLPSDLRGSGRGLYVQMNHAFQAIDDADPERQARLWYDWHEPHGGVFDGIGSAFLLCPRVVSLDFPNLHGGRLCDGTSLHSGQLIAVLSENAQARALAEAALSSVGFTADLEGEKVIPGPVRGMSIWFLRVSATPTAGQAGGLGPIRERPPG